MGFSLCRARVNLGIGQQEEGDEESLKILEFCSQNQNPSTINAPKILDKMFWSEPNPQMILILILRLDSDTHLLKMHAETKVHDILSFVGGRWEHHWISTFLEGFDAPHRRR
jgi:hypothetical protein